MTLISFIIPCGRPFISAGEHTVNSILKYHSIYNTEILLCSKTPIRHFNNIHWIPEPLDNVGAVLPINMAAQLATGKFVCVLNDDVELTGSIYPLVQEIILKKLISLAIMPFHWKPQQYDPAPIDDTLVFDDIHNMSYPVIRKEFIIINNHLFHPQFIHHFADCFLPVYLKYIYKQNQFVYEDGTLYVKYNEKISKKSLDFFSKKDYLFDSIMYKSLVKILLNREYLK